MTYDALFAGAGLANLLAAYRLKCAQPSLKFLILEKAAEPADIPNHTWSFHQTDLTVNAWKWLSPFVERSWQGYDVHFPGYSRELRGNYHAIESQAFLQRMIERLSDHMVFDCALQKVTAHSVSTISRSWDSECVFDGRGWEPQGSDPVAYQKFLGRRVRLSKPHGLRRPVIMDATVPQLDGYRFFYLLPWSEHEILVEDTRYSDGPQVVSSQFSDQIEAYCRRRGWLVESTVYEEIGVLPIPLGGSAPVFGNGVIALGTRGHFFHAATGYSLPDSVRTAELLAALRPWSHQLVFSAMRKHSFAHWKQGRYLRALNRMLFYAAGLSERYRVLQRFYRLPESLIEHFYAGQLTATDKIRLLIGRPPVPIGGAVRALWNTSGQGFGQGKVEHGSLY